MSLRNEFDLNAILNEDDHLTSLQPQGFIEGSVGTLSADEVSGDGERTMDPTTE